MFLPLSEAYLLGGFPVPPWPGREELHRSHRSELLAKAPEFSAPRFAGTPDDLDDVRPVATS